MMPLARAHAAAVVGVTGHLVTAEACVTSGVPGLHLLGLADTVIAETRDRVRAAIINSGLNWPSRSVTVSLFPASLPKRGSGFDLAIAVTLLAAAGFIDVMTIAEALFVGELGLDGRVRPVRGVLPAVLAAAGTGIRTVYVPVGNSAEVVDAGCVSVVPVGSLAEVIGRLRSAPDGFAPDRTEVRPPEPMPSTPRPAPAGGTPGTWRPDLADVIGNQAARHALEVCAAGGHHLALKGPPGSGMTMLAERLPTILPPLDEQAAQQVAAVHSCAGVPAPTGPPFVGPHHTTTVTGMCGSGSARTLPHPGALSLAHRGVLFLDQAGDFSAQALDMVATAVETGETSLRNGGGAIALPARFQLIITQRDVPGPRPGEDHSGYTPPSASPAWAAPRLSALLDRIEVVATTQAAPAQAFAFAESGEASSVVADRVLAARDRTAARFADTPWRTNAGVPGPYLRRLTARALTDKELAPIERAATTGALSARRVVQVLRVAWTLADLRGSDHPNREDITMALSMQRGE